MLTIIDTLEQLNQSKAILQNEPIIACDLEADDLNIKSAMKGIGYGTNKQVFFIPFPNGIDKQRLGNFLLELFQKTIVFHNAKYDMEVLLHNTLPIPIHFHDTMIMSWLIDENKQHGLKLLVKEIFDRQPKKWNELNNTVDLFRTQEDVNRELAEYCAEDVVNTFDLFNYFYPQLEKEGVKIDYERVELKLIPVLIHMEMRGIKVDVSMLQQKQEEAKAELSKLEQEIIKKIEEKVNKDCSSVNIRSPKQVESILFDIFRYPVVKETKSGKRSTDNEVLTKIIKKENLSEFDVVTMLLRFRDLDKVYSTYFIALAEQAGIQNVIHTNFLQHGTDTGRLSSSDPNIQNIPTRHDKWDVRKAFIARKGYKFLIVDYNQIELRMLAHFSRDQNMLDTFLSGGDIHKRTMELTGIKDRKIAKNVNFGMVYGIGPRTLADIIETKEDEAKEYIRRFFVAYPQVRPFITRVQQQALRQGYVEMLTGRKRHFQEIYDKRWYNAIARQAINSKIQGSAADLVKIAMIRLDPLVWKLGAYMLVQVHDELIIETLEDKVEEVKKVVKDTMEHALVLRIPLQVSIIESDRWVKE